MKNSLIYFFIAFSFIIGCGNGGPKKGEDLKGTDAVEYLAGDDKKTWKLDSGHDYYEYLQFDTQNGAMFQSATAIKYEVDAAKLTMKDFQDFVYSILEISHDKLVLAMTNHDTLTYIKCNDKIEAGKTLGKAIDGKWLKGKFGTTWKFVDGEKVYSFMNDGTIIDASTLTKVDTWSIDGTTLNFGSTKLTIFRLSPVFFDYDVYGMTVKLNYKCEANKDGSPSR